MEEDIKNMSKEELLEYLEEISQQLDNIALDQIQFAISELQFFKEEYKKLEEENKQLRIDNTDKLCEECSELVKQAGITKDDTNRILKEYRDRVENSIPISVIQDTLDDTNKNIEEFTKNVVTTKEEIEQEYWKSELNKAIAKRNVLQEILEEGRK